MHATPRILWPLLLTGCALIAACDSTQTPPPTQPEAAAAEHHPSDTATPPAAAERDAPASPTRAPDIVPHAGWTVLANERLSEDERAQLQRARAAQKALGSTLIKTVTAAVAADGHAAGIKACNVEASGIAQRVRQDHDVQIGRTSHKVRNPDNSPNDWMQPVVDARYDGVVLQRGPEGQLGMAAPIHLAEMCTSCHGTSQQLAEGVPEALATLYPEDRATGFAPGDLRGWFWVEVPAQKPAGG